MKRLGHKPTETQQKTPLEQAKEVIDKAERFDRLVREPGWEDILTYMATNVQGEIAEATKYVYEPDLARNHVLVWNAKRSLLDGAIGYIESIQRSRDEIVSQYRKEKEEVNVGNESGY